MAASSRRFRNFVWRPTDFAIHWAVSEALRAKGKTVHMTDMGKGSAIVNDAGKHRKRRWDPLAAFPTR